MSKSAVICSNISYKIVDFYCNIISKISCTEVKMPLLLKQRIQQGRRCIHVMTLYSSYECNLHLCIFFRSAELLNSEASLSLSECRLSSDSNKASSGEVSPYDNNSPVLSERRGGDLAKESEVHSGRVHSTERLYCVPEQYSLVGQVTGRSRETGSNIWSPTKGELR